MIGPSIVPAWVSEDATRLLNKPAMRAVLAYIDSDPTQWDQRYFESEDNGTRCLAGIACHLAGVNPVELMTATGDPMSVYDTARELLGLTEEQADQLFLQFVSWNGTHPTTGQLREEIKVWTGWDVDDPDD